MVRRNRHFMMVLVGDGFLRRKADGIKKDDRIAKLIYADQTIPPGGIVHRVKVQLSC